MLLAGTWLAARVLTASSGLWPPYLVSAVDLAFLPTLGALVARPLLRSKSRNTPLLLVLAVFWLTNVGFHFGLLHGNAPLALRALHIGIDVVLVLVTIIGGRIVVRNRTAVTVLAITSMLAVTLIDVFAPETYLAGAAAGLAALAQAARLGQWGGWHTRRQPIVWVLHLSYAWLPVGLALKAIALLWGPAFAAFWLHGLTIGVLATMTLAVMTRASLGHTGRPLIVDPLITLAYLLLTAAAVIRVFGLAFGLNYPSVIVLAALCWSVAFGIFLVIYAPILWRPRIDGKTG
jgi:uncharacterized protein involved in response to NO